MPKTIKDYIDKKLQPLMSVFAQAALGNFQQDVAIPDEEDEFAELYAGIQIMLNVIHQKVTNLEAEIENRKKIEAELQHNQLELEAILENIGDGLIVTDKEGTITIINNAAEEMLGWDKKDIVGKLLMDAVPMEDEEGNIIPFERRPMSLVLNSGKKMIGSYWYERRDKTKVPIAIIATPLIIAGEIIGSTEVFRDITPEKELDRRKDDFIALASHEMKTPVTSLKIFTQGLEKILERKGQKELMPQLKKMDKQLTRMADLVNNLLDASRDQKEKLLYKKEKFSIDHLIEESVENIQRITSTHKLIFDEKAGKRIQGDRDKIEQVLINLINNAIKYSPKGKKVIIQSTESEGEIIVKVKDFGMGIPKRQQKEIFDRFYQGENNVIKTYPGLGLGLYISSQIIERHNGKIWVESEEGRGATFFFSLPFR